MDQMNKIAINTEVVEQIERAYKELKFTEPKVDIDKELNTYVNSLEYEEEHERENKVIRWVTDRVSGILSTWAASYAPSSQLLQKTNTEIDSLAELKKDEQRNIYNTQAQIATKNEEKQRKEEAIDTHKVRINETKTIDLNEEKKKAIGLLLFSFFIAIGTFVYFMNAQINIKWSTISKSEKVAQVKEMLLGGALNQYSAFERHIRVDDNSDETVPLEQLKLSDLSGITIEHIDMGPTPTVMQALKYDMSLFTLAFISFILILFGKVTAILYEKIGYPRWMYSLLWIMFGLILVAAIFSVSALDEKQIYKNSLIGDMQKLEIQLKNEKDSQVAGFGGGYESDTAKSKSAEEIRIEKEIEGVREELKVLIASIGAFKFWTMILFLFSEVIVGSLGWISYAEYIEKRVRVKNSGGDVLEQLQDEFKAIHEKIVLLTNQVKQSQERISQATGLESRLVAVKSNLFSTAKIHNIEKQHLDSALAQGRLALQTAVHRWKASESKKSS